MADLEFDGIQIDVETVRRKLEEHDARDNPQWPVRIADIGIEGVSTAYITFKAGGYMTVQEPKSEALHEFHMDLDIAKYIVELQKNDYKEVPPAAPVHLRNRVKYGVK